MIKKIGDTKKAKLNLKPPFYVKEIDSKYSKGHRLLAKKDKEDIYWEPQNEVSKDKNKTKSHSSSTFANQSQPQALKKEKRGCWRGHRGHPATEVNATKVAKKNKTPKNLSHIKYYICYQKDHSANKYPDKPKN